MPLPHENGVGPWDEATLEAGAEDAGAEELCVGPDDVCAAIHVPLWHESPAQQLLPPQGLPALRHRLQTLLHVFCAKV